MDIALDEFDKEIDIFEVWTRFDKNEKFIEKYCFKCPGCKIDLSAASFRPKNLKKPYFRLKNNSNKHLIDCNYSAESKTESKIDKIIKQFDQIPFNLEKITFFFLLN